MHLTRTLAALAALLILAACGGSSRPVYSGHEESTEGVPGFSNGKKQSPYVKLGQSYTVDGETYVPRNQPDYVEVGMASWYGPGFHGGKTANGERFDSNALTAAHRTLPLPSIVRVTMMSTGKQVYVRINDRGPFAHSRIIDLSRAAAEKIGLLRAGVGKVRVEYMQQESRRFAELLASGRDPQSIDMASEVLSYDSADNTNAQEENISPEAAPVAQVTASDLPASTPVASQKSSVSKATSPFAALEDEAGGEAVAQVSAPTSVDTEGNFYIQLGAFQNAENAARVQKKYADITDLRVIKKESGAGVSLYHVRTAPFTQAGAVNALLQKLRDVGADGRVIHE